MKKLLLTLLCTALTCSVTACNNEQKTAENFEKEYGKVTLCDYKNLSAEKEIYTITEDKINEAIDNMLYDYAETKTVTRPSKAEDSVYMTMTVSKGDEILMEYVEEDEYSIFIGYAEFGEEFDEKLTGVSANDELDFSITYEEDYDYTDFAGATINFKIKVLKVTEDVIPELTDSFIKETLEYDSKDDLINSVKEQIATENEQNSESNLREDLITQVIDNSTFESYSQELYDRYSAMINDTYESYATMFGYDSVDDIYDAFGMTKEDVEEEILSSVYREIAVAAIADKEDISITDKEYKANLTVMAKENGYENDNLMEEDYGEDTLRNIMLEEDVLDLLVKHADIKEVEVDENAEFDDYEDEDADSDASDGELADDTDEE